VQTLNYCVLHEDSYLDKHLWKAISQSTFHSPQSTHSPEVVELADVVEVTGCEETETITNGNRC